MEGMTLEKLQVIIEAYTKPYKEELDKIKQKTSAVTSQVERETSKMRNAYRKVAAAAGTVLSIAAITAFGKSCVELGSNLTEVQNVVDVTFGDMNRKVDAFSKNAIKQFGLSELTAKKYMGTYGAMAKAFNITGEAGYQMSASITGLTGDVASFYNLTTDEAFTKLKSIFTGETESIKELGVVMTQTALDQYALNNGFGKTTAKMTEQEKVMLRYQFVMSSLSDASEDFARTSHTWANQVRVLGLQFESLKATIGQGLINAFTPVIRVVNELLAKLQTLAAYFKTFTTALFGDANGGTAMSGAADSLASAAGSSGSIADNMNAAAGAAKKMKDYTLGIDELNVLNPESDSSGSGDAGGAGAPDFGSMSGTLFGDVTVNPEIEAATDRIRQAVEKLKETAQPTTDALNRLWDDGLAKLGNFSWTALRDFWDYFLKPLGVWTLGEGFPRFVDITNEFLGQVNWGEINDALREFWKALEPFAENVGEGLLWFYENVAAPFGTWAIETVLPEVIELFASALKSVDEIAGVVGPLLSDLYHEIMEPFGKWIGNVFIDALKGWQKAFEAIGNYLSEHEELAAALTGIAIGIGLISAAMSLNPFALIVIGLTAIGTGIGYVIENWDYIVKAFSDGWKDIKQYFLDGWNGIKSWWENSALVVWWNEDVSPWFTAKKWSNLYQTIKTELGNTWTGTVTQWKSGVSSWWGSHVSPWFTIARWKTLYDTIKSQLGQTWRETSGEWKTNLLSWWNLDVSPWFTIAKWLGIYNSIRSSLKETWNLTRNAWKLDIGNWWKNNVETWFTLDKWTGMMSKVPDAFRDIFKNAVNAAVYQLNKLIDWINDKLNFEFDGLEILGEEIIPSFSIQLFTIPHIPELASGGVVNSGQLFIANEAGPELVGRYGNRTGVMNNDQIVSAVSNGVAEAMANVMAAYEDRQSSDQPIEVTISLDGRTISKTLHKTDRRSGFKFRPV